MVGVLVWPPIMLRIGEGIDDGVADDVHAPAAERVERAAQSCRR